MTNRVLRSHLRGWLLIADPSSADHQMSQSSEPHHSKVVRQGPGCLQRTQPHAPDRIPSSSSWASRHRARQPRVVTSADGVTMPGQSVPDSTPCRCATFLQLTGALWRAAPGPEDRSPRMLALIFDGLRARS
jgi:hypothetical protein